MTPWKVLFWVRDREDESQNSAWEQPGSKQNRYHHLFYFIQIVPKPKPLSWSVGEFPVLTLPVLEGTHCCVTPCKLSQQVWVCAGFCAGQPQAALTRSPSTEGSGRQRRKVQSVSRIYCTRGTQAVSIFPHTFSLLFGTLAVQNHTVSSFKLLRGHHQACAAEVVPAENSTFQISVLNTSTDQSCTGVFVSFFIRIWRLAWLVWPP